MAGRIGKDQKDRLVATGQWGGFLARRDELKTQGYAPRDARATALLEALAKCTEGDGSTAQAGGGDSSRSLPAAPANLGSAAAAEPEVVRWVARHIDAPDPDPEACPDPFAWTLLRLCRENPAFTRWFVDKLWSKLIPSRSHLDTRTSREFDGKPTLELIERIQAMREEVIEETGRSSLDARCCDPRIAATPING